jgi:hypothetical protein
MEPGVIHSFLTFSHECWVLTPLFPMFARMGREFNAFEIRNIVVSPITIFMMNNVTFWYDTEAIHPNMAM